MRKNFYKKYILYLNIFSIETQKTENTDLYKLKKNLKLSNFH